MSSNLAILPTTSFQTLYRSKTGVQYRLVNNPPPPVGLPTVDFGWYYGVGDLRVDEYKYEVGTSTYPPCVTTLSSPVTLSPTTPFTISVASTTGFETPGFVTLYDETNRIACSYIGKTATTFTGCLQVQNVSTPYTFAGGSSVYDARFYVDSMPLNQTITFDALNSLGLGTPVTIPASGTSIINYSWDFGNGSTGIGSEAVTIYTYSKAVPTIQATLTITDSKNRVFSTAKQLNLIAMTPATGAKISVGNGPSR